MVDPAKYGHPHPGPGSRPAMSSDAITAGLPRRPLAAAARVLLAADGSSWPPPPLYLYGVALRHTDWVTPCPLTACLAVRERGRRCPHQNCSGPVVSGLQEERCTAGGAARAVAGKPRVPVRLTHMSHPRHASGKTHRLRAPGIIVPCTNLQSRRTQSHVAAAPGNDQGPRSGRAACRRPEAQPQDNIAMGTSCRS